MKLEQFRNTRIVMTVNKYKDTYDKDFDETDEETVKMHVYKDGLYLRETINGFLHNDLGVEQATCSDLKLMEVKFWFEYAEDFYNKKPKTMKKVLLPIGIRRDLALLKRVMGSLTEQWLDADDDITEYLSRHYPDPKSFDDLTTHLSIWINAMELEQRDISKDFIEEISKIPETEEDEYIAKSRKAILIEMEKDKNIKPGSIYTQEDKPEDIKHTPHPDSEVAHAMAEMYRQREHQPYTDQEYLDIAGNMEMYAGSFFKLIGSALFKADQENKKKLAEAFPEEFDKYLNLK